MPTIDQTVHEAFVAVAPELDDELREIDTDVDVWVELQLDSMDHLAVVEQLSRSLGRDIPEADYPELVSIAAIRRYMDAAAT